MLFSTCCCPGIASFELCGWLSFSLSFSGAFLLVVMSSLLASPFSDDSLLLSKGFLVTSLLLSTNVFPLRSCTALHSSFGLGIVSLGSELEGLSTEICLEICPICLSRLFMEASWVLVVISWCFHILSIKVSKLVSL